MALLDRLRRLWHATDPASGTGGSSRGALGGLSVPPDDERTEKLSQLTARERELFALLLEGYTLKESAQRLNIGYSTANTHMTSLYKKLQVRSRAELIIRYHHAGGTS